MLNIFKKRYNVPKMSNALKEFLKEKAPERVRGIVDSGATACR